MENFINLKSNNNQKYSSNQINDAFNRKTKDEKKFLKNLNNDKNKNKNKINDVINNTFNTTFKYIKKLLNYPNKEHFNPYDNTIGNGIFYIIMFIIMVVLLYYAYCHFYKGHTNCSINIYEKVTSAFGKKHIDTVEAVST